MTVDKSRGKLIGTTNFRKQFDYRFDYRGQEEGVHIYAGSELIARISVPMEMDRDWISDREYLIQTNDGELTVSPGGGWMLDSLVADAAHDYCRECIKSEVTSEMAETGMRNGEIWGRHFESDQHWRVMRFNRKLGEFQDWIEEKKQWGQISPNDEAFDYSKFYDFCSPNVRWRHDTHPRWARYA